MNYQYVLACFKREVETEKNGFGKSLPITAVGSIWIPNTYTHFGQWIHMDPYYLTMTDDVKLIFLTKMRYLGQKELLVKFSDFLLQAIITWPIKG